MTKTIKVTEKQAEALIWAINIFQMTSEGIDDYDLADDYAKAVKALAAVYAQL